MSKLVLEFIASDRLDRPGAGCVLLREEPDEDEEDDDNDEGEDLEDEDDDNQDGYSE